MGAIRSYLRLSPVERRLALRAWWWVMCIQASLRLLRFKRTRRWLARRRSTSLGELQPAPSDEEIARIDRAVRSASKRVPGARCLAEVMAGQVLLARAGLLANLRIGVGRHGGGELEAHAWLEHGGRVVLGDRRPDEFEPLNDFEREGR